MNDLTRAQRRLQSFVNRSAGQHMRAMKASRPQDAYIDGTDEPYNAQESQDEAQANQQIEHDKESS